MKNEEGRERYAKAIRETVLNDENRDRVEAFEERAAIMEYEGGLPREEAERLAYEIVYGKLKRA